MWKIKREWLFSYIYFYLYFIRAHSPSPCRSRSAIRVRALCAVLSAILLFLLILLFFVANLLSLSDSCDMTSHVCVYACVRVCVVSACSALCVHCARVWWCMCVFLRVHLDLIWYFLLFPLHTLYRRARDFANAHTTYISIKGLFARTRDATEPEPRTTRTRIKYKIKTIYSYILYALRSYIFYVKRTARKPKAENEQQCDV